MASPFTSPVSLTAPNEYSAQELAIQRRSQLAQALLQQGQEPLQTNQTAGGYVIPISPLQGLAKALQTGLGAYGMAQQNKAELDLAKNYQSNLRDTLSRAWVAMDGTPASPEQPYPATMGSVDDEGNAMPPVAQAQAAVPPNPRAAQDILMGNTGTQELGMGLFQQNLNQSLVRSLMGPQGDAAAPVASPAPAPVGTQAPEQPPAPAQDDGTIWPPRYVSAPQPNATPSSPPAMPTPPSQAPGNDMQATISRLMLSGNPTAMAYARFLQEQSKLSGGVQYDQHGNAFTLDTMGNVHPLAGIQARPDGIVQGTGDTTGLVDKHTGQPIGPRVPMGVAPKVEMVNNGQSIQPTIVGADGAKPVGAPTQVQVSPNTQASNAITVRGQNMTDARTRELNGILANGQQNPAIETTAQAIADYKLAPLTGFAMKTPFGQQTMARVMALNPQYNAQNYASGQAGIKAFTSGHQGDIVRSLGVATQHIGQLDQAAQALQRGQPGDIQAFNKIANFIGAQVGQPAPTTFAALSHLVGDEVSKAIIGAKGTGGDRDKAAAMFSGANSPQQWASVRNGVIGLMGGQLNGLRQQYKAATQRDDFDQTLLSPEAQAVLGGTGGTAATSKAPAGVDPGTWAHMTAQERALWQ